MSIDPENVGAAFARAACYNSLGQFSKAIEDYNAALIKDQFGVNSPLKVEPSRRRTISYSFTNPADERPVSPPPSSSSGSSSTVMSIPPIPGNNPTPRVNSFGLLQATASVNISEKPKASIANTLAEKINKAKIIREANNENPIVEKLHAEGYRLRREGKFFEAIAEYTKALDIMPTHFKALFNRGFAYDKINLLDKAIADYSQAIFLEPDNAFAFYNRGISYDKSSQFDNAISDFSKAILLQPSNPDFFHNRGFCYRKLNRLTEAIQDFTKVIELNPKHVKSYSHR